MTTAPSHHLTVEYLWRKHRRRLRWYLSKMLSRKAFDPHLVDDFEQLTWIRIWQYLPRYRPPSAGGCSVVRWLWMMGAHTVNWQWRNWARRQENFAQVALVDRDQVTPDVTAPVAEQRVLVGLVLGALDVLSHQQRDVVALRIADRPWREIGAAVGMSHQGAQQAYARAIHRIRAELHQSRGPVEQSSCDADNAWRKHRLAVRREAHRRRRLTRP